MNGRLRHLALALVGAMLAMSCGGSDDSGGEGNSTGGAPAATGGTGGTPAATGGTTSDPGAVPCGQMMCPAPTDPTLMACCKDPFSGTCGVLSGTDCGDPPPPSDPTCPPVGAGPIMLAGCCIDGMCGIDATDFGAGCVELGMAAEQAGMFGGGMVTFPPPQACGGA